MRLHISLDDDIVQDLDRRVGRRQRSAFIASAVRGALDDERRWNDIEGAVGRLRDSEHEWDADPQGWVRVQRAGDARRLG
jgi:Arc/MetJ family transcription regulator